MPYDSRAPKSNFNVESWENAEFPILCETCLGDNPYVRMSKMEYGASCKICDRPFTLFRWKPGKQSRYKQTEICQECAKSKNICQTCLLDLTYGLPVQVRDAFLNGSTTLQKGYKDAPQSKPLNNDLLRLARTKPYYKRNLPHICSFYARGMCTRGNACPYRHELPQQSEDDPLAKQNIVDRFNGQNDPVAEKILRNNKPSEQLVPPENPNIRTLYIGNLDTTITKKDLENLFYSHGEILSLKINPREMCAYVEYSKREDAERAVSALYKNLSINGRDLTVAWSIPINDKQTAYRKTVIPLVGYDGDSSTTEETTKEKEKEKEKTTS